MPTTTKKKPLRLIDAVPSVDFDTVLNKASPKDRGNIMRYLDTPPVGACNQSGLWKRVFSVMSALSPHAVQTSGQLSVQFFIADGKHRLQVFALEDARQGAINVYIPDCLEMAVNGGLLAEPAEVEDALIYPIRDGGEATLKVERLTASNTMNAPEFFKHMLGWNRKAVRVTLPQSASAVEVHAVEILCVLGAQLRVPQGAPAPKR